MMHRSRLPILGRRSTRARCVVAGAAVVLWSAGCTPLATRLPEVPALEARDAAARGHWVLVEEHGSDGALAGRALFVFTRANAVRPAANGKHRGDP